MTFRTHLIRKAITFLATAAAATLSVPAAMADPPQGHRGPSVQPDVVERYVASGRGQTDVVERWVDGRARVGNEAMLRARLRGLEEISRPIGFRDGRPDGYRPQVQGAASTSTTTVDDGFSWEDAGIGALAGFALTLLASGTVLAARARGRIAHS